MTEILMLVLKQGSSFDFLLNWSRRGLWDVKLPLFTVTTTKPKIIKKAERVITTDQ